MVRAKWLAWIQAQNHAALGATQDLESFMFGPTRADLGGVKEALLEAQEGVFLSAQRRSRPCHSPSRPFHSMG
jgi:hypothetical protein